MRVDIWSDVVCPWCYIGKRRIENAVASFEHGDRIELAWHSFELDPGAPATHDGDNASRLAAKYRVSLDHARQMIDRVTRTAAGDGLDFHLDRARSGNTFDAHRVLHLARERSRQTAVMESLMRGYFCDGEPIGLRETLFALATAAGLDAGEVNDVLAGDRYTADVRADEQLARELGITGVPFYVIDGRFGVSGAQSPDVLRGVLDRAWSDAAMHDAGATVGSDPR
jgi:predicted DsbA family dithiol-disulfide isomerase